MRSKALLAAFLLLFRVYASADKVNDSRVKEPYGVQGDSNQGSTNIGEILASNGCPFQSGENEKLPGNQDKYKLLFLKIFPPYIDNDEGCQETSPSEPNCNPLSLYRTMNGSCNNLQNPSWGTAGECQRRFLPANYDGEDGFKRSISGKPLPEPRDLVLNIFRDMNRPTLKVSHMFTIFGQVIVHDTIKAPFPFTKSCCPSSENSNRSAEECRGIAVRDNDPFYSQFNQTCLFFVRSYQCTKCEKGKISPRNAVTAAVDLSLVYGHSDEVADGLRTKDGTGRLKFEENTVSGPLLPPDDGTCIDFCPSSPGITYFKAGDTRVNQHSGLMSLQTLFMREHNRVAVALKEINPLWDEERLYQEARKILGAQMQSIVFKDYLPLLLGPVFMSHFDLWVRSNGTGTKYNVSTRIGFWAEVGTAAFRLHSMVASKTGTPGLLFRDTYSNTIVVKNGMLDQFLNDAGQVPSQMYDRWVSEDVSNYLARPPKAPFGGDLTSVNIQRSRDHGLPFYVDVVKFVTEGQLDIKCFDELSILMTEENIELLKQNYNSVSDVELWVGMNLEKTFPGSQVGFTSAALVAKQFYNLKYGDRYFFEHENESVSFTTAQRESLKKITLSRIFCNNLKINSTKRNIFLLSDEKNREISCNELPDVDLNLWKSDY